jgi:pyrroline-5-carboxylate reductase
VKHKKARIMGDLPNIVLVGCGKMGSALVEGWLKTKIVNRVYTLDPAGLPDDFKDYSPNPVQHFKSSNELYKHINIKNIDLHVLAVKPQLMQKVCLELKGHLSEKDPILSIAAGQKILSFHQYLYDKSPIIRAMPNTPASISKGISVAVANEFTNQATIEVAEQLLSSVGQVEWIDDEQLLDAVTALSGSGPAYVFYLIEALDRAGQSIGLNAQLSMKLARATVIGSAALAEAEPSIHPKTLRENVTSPGGTTEAALSILMDNRFQNILNEALDKAVKRSIELS